MGNKNSFPKPLPASVPTGPLAELKRIDGDIILFLYGSVPGVPFTNGSRYPYLVQITESQLGFIRKCIRLSAPNGFYDDMKVEINGDLVSIWPKVTSYVPNKPYSFHAHTNVFMADPK